MVAGLLYLIGLIAVLASIVVLGYGSPAMFQTFSAAMDSGNQNMVGVVAGLLTQLSWSVTPLVGGLVLMGMGRIIMLLGAINRSLRGHA